MRLVLAVVVMLAGVLSSVPADAQAPAPAPPQYPYGLDPYKPSDADLLRKYGSALVAQTPLVELRKLDPYKPSEAALLRDFGGAIPAWAFWYPMGPIPGPYTPFATASAVGSAPPNVIFVVVPQPSAGDAATRAPATASSPPPPTSLATLSRPQTNDGVWIGYAGQRWISSGPAVEFEESSFTRIGQYVNVPVFRRRGGNVDVIYLPTREGLVAPYRAKK